MMVSLFLAKLLGLYLIVVSGTMLLNKRDVSLLFGLYKHPEAVYLTGVLDTFLGLLLVLSHNIWALDYRLVITLAGWALLVRGIGRMLAPDKVTGMVESMKKMGSGMMMVLMVVVLVLGVYLAYSGFTG